MEYNQLIPREGCQLYVVPAGGQFNLTKSNGTLQIVETAHLWLLAVDCNLTEAQSQYIYNTMLQEIDKGPFRSSLTPLMIVLSLCLTASVIILAVLGILRRTPRPWFHKFVLLYVTSLLCTVYGLLHSFSRDEHMKGFESTDSFVQYFFSTRRCIALFLPSAGFLICEAHILVSLFSTPLRKRIIMSLFGFLLMLDTAWWVAGVIKEPIFHQVTRKMNYCVRIYFYVEILCHFVYFVTFGYAVYSLWHYAFYRNNRAIGVLSLVTSVIPFISMLVTAIARGCFVWSLPLSMITRAVGLLILWEWKVAITTTMARLERDDNIGRLVSEPKMIKQFKELSGSGAAHGTLSEKGMFDKFVSALRHPRALVQSLNIMEIRTSDTVLTEQTAPRHVLDQEEPSAAAAAPTVRGQVTQYPVHKHTVRVVDQSSAGSGPRSSRTRPSAQTRPPSPSLASSNPGSSIPGSSIPGSSIPGPSIPGSSIPPSIPGSSIPPSIPGPSLPFEPQPPQPEELPRFVPHPGFQSDDYHDEKS